MSSPRRRAGPIAGPIAEALAAGDGLLRASECERLRISRGRLYRLVDRGALVEVAKGVYADATRLDGGDPWTVFRLRSRAFLMVSPPNAFAADWSSIVLHGLPTLGAPPRVPSVLRPGSRGSGSNTTLWGRTRFAIVRDRWLGAVDGTSAVRPAFAAVDLARRAPAAAALVVVDAVAHRAGDRAELVAALADVAGWAGAGRAARVVRLCDPDVESPLESLGRLAFLQARLPRSLSNCWVGEHQPEFRLDHYWPAQRVGAEGDGLSKYLLTDPIAALRKEKAREWRLQQLGIRLVRYTWSNAFGSPGALGAQARRLLDEGRPPAPTPVRVWSRADGAAMLGIAPSPARR